MRSIYEKRPLSAWGVMTLLVCIILAVTIDPWLATTLKAKISDEQAHYLRMITDLGRAGTYISCSFIAFICFVFLSLRNRQFVQKHISHFYVGARNSLFVFYTLVISGVAINVLKLIIGRQRPKAMFEDGFYGFIPFNINHAMNSFPSGHSQTGWALAISLAIIFPKATYFLIIFATMISLSRVLLTVHFLSDIIAGAFISIITAILLKRHYLDKADAESLSGLNTTDRIIEKYGPRFLMLFSNIFGFLKKK